MKAEEMLKHLKSVVFPQLASLAKDESSFGEYMRGAECKINKPSLLVEAVNLKVPVAQRSGIDQMEISQQNQDVQGDLTGFHRTLVDSRPCPRMGCDGLAPC